MTLTLTYLLTHSQIQIIFLLLQASGEAGTDARLLKYSGSRNAHEIIEAPIDVK